MSPVQIYKMDLKDPDLNRIRQLAVDSRAGKWVVFPTETVYGIGAPMTSTGIHKRLAALKGRAPEKPFSYHLGEWEMVDRLRVVQTPAFRHLSRVFWPGPVTLIVQDELERSIGLRFPRHRLAAALIQAAGEPFVATSANASGEPAPKSAEDVLNGFKPTENYILIDGGPCEFAQDSTVVDLTSGEGPQIVRNGALAAEVAAEIEKINAGQFVRKRILVVCTGNSCRSPMAEGLLLDEFRKKGLADQIHVSSCGIGTRGGSKATPEAVLVMKNLEIDISAHRSKPCVREDVTQADLILAMAKEHSDFITNLMPQARSKIRVLSVVDPIGMNMLIYEAVLVDIQKKLKNLWSEIIA